MHSHRARLVRSLAAAFLCVVLTNAGVLAQTAQAPRAYPISGVVIDQQGGLPVAGARLQLMQATKAIAASTSDVSGKFAFPAVAEGIYFIQVSAPGYQTVRSDDVVLAGGPATVSLALTRAQTSTSSGLKTIAHVSTRAVGLQTTTTIQQQVDPEIMQRVGQLRAAEGLVTLPGVNLVGQDSSVGDDISVDIRGLKPSETQVLLDGHPIGPYGVYPSRIGGGTGGFDYQDAPTFALQNTVVTYGSGATGLYGVDAVGGAVDFQTILPSLRPQGALKIGYGELGKQLFAAQASGTFGKLGYVFLHGVNGAYGNFPGAVIAQTGARGSDFTTPTLQGVTYFVSGDYLLRNDLAKLQYNFSRATQLTLTGYSATSWDDKTGEGDNDFITYDFARYQAQNSPNCTIGNSPAPNGVTVITDAAPNGACVTPQQYASGASGPAGGGPGAYQALGNQDYHLRFTTTAGRNQVTLDSYIDNYHQNRDRPASFLNGPNAILDIDYRSFGTLLSDDLALGKHDVGFGLFSMRQYTTGHNVSGTTVLEHQPLFDKLDSFFVRDVWQPKSNLSFFLNSWFKHSNVGGTSFDPRLSVIYRPNATDVVRLTGGKSSADPAPLALQLTGVGGITPGNCKIFSVGEDESPNELPEKATDLEASYAHRFSIDTSVQAIAYDTNEINTVFQGQLPAALFMSALQSAGADYLPSVLAKISSLCPNFAPPNPAPTIDNLVMHTNVNIAKQRARGIELSGRFRVDPHATVQGYYDVQSTAIYDAPVDLLQNNPTLINGGQVAGIPLHKWGVTFDLTNTHGGEVYLVYTHLDANNPLHRPAFGWADAAFTQSISQNLAVNLGVTNLFNSAADDYGRIGWGVFIPENQYGTDPNGLAQGTEEFGLAPRAVLFTLTEKM